MCPACKVLSPGRAFFNRRVLPNDPAYKAKVAALKEARDLCRDVVSGIELNA